MDRNDAGLARQDATRQRTAPRVHHPFPPIGGNMQATDVRALDAGRRVQVFLDAQAATVGKVVAPSLRAKLDDSVTQLAGFQDEQGTADGAAKGETANQAALRDDLFQKFMVPIARTAKIALKSAPEFPKLVVSALARRKADF